MPTTFFQSLVDIFVRGFPGLTSLSFLKFIGNLFRRFVLYFFVLAALVSIVLSGYTLFRQRQDRQLKFFVSAGSGGGADQIDTIQKKIRDEWNIWGPNFLVNEFQTGGSLDNLRNVKRDQEGSAIGMAIEGLEIDENDANDLRTLVPLE
jgi:hypothetical protein